MQQLMLALAVSFRACYPHTSSWSKAIAKAIDDFICKDMCAYIVKFRHMIATLKPNNAIAK